MKLLVTDRNAIESGTEWPSRYCVISIHDCDASPAIVKVQPGLRSVLQPLTPTQEKQMVHVGRSLGFYLKYWDEMQYLHEELQ